MLAPETKKTAREIYLINPANPDNFWTMQSSVDAVGVKTLMPSIALATLVSLTPGDCAIKYSYGDENISSVDLKKNCDLVAITGYTLHEKRIAEIASAFRKRGVPVALGGSFATLYPDRAREMCDYLFIREAEYTWPLFLREWMQGNAKRIYEQKEFIDLNDSPPPDWSFVRGKDYLYFALQTSRGCPNNCDFCDAIRLVGRKYRHKSIEQIMAEIRNACDAGAETVFFSEDNFFVNRNFTKQLLTEIIAWNTTLPRPLSFSCQATVMIGEDDEILRLMADARFAVIFLGVESVRKECLAEVNKGHMTRFDPERSVKNISRYGIIPFIGFIVGFDHDDLNSFGEIEDFLVRTGSPIASISVLNAPEGTRLYERMESAGRIRKEFGGQWHLLTNIIPRSMTFEELTVRHRTLFKRVYEPAAFEQRVLTWMTGIEYFTTRYRDSSTNWSKLKKFFPILKFYFLREPRAVRSMFFRLLKQSWKINPRLIKKTITLMTQYCHYHDFAEKTYRDFVMSRSGDKRNND
ncbi:MAG TPA: radical SAM protein [Spirochaetota bacterium]|nr:radical SAM protein [Spirochaetota bacterium]HPI88873.1 radical SAM protein [Spirochaetota bacterium]HPR46997.1 radical SAM protein [Spirochaetota bacterium]